MKRAIIINKPTGDYTNCDICRIRLYGGEEAFMVDATGNGEMDHLCCDYCAALYEFPN